MASQPDGGYALIYRTLLDHPVFRDEPEAWAFASLILRAAWRPTRVRYKDRVMVLERGQLALSVRDFGKRWGRTKDWAQRFLERLEDAQMVRRKRYSAATGDATGPNVITICNYDKYQDRSIDAATGGDRQPRQDRDRTATQNKEGKEVKEGKKDNTPIVPSSRKLATAWTEGHDVPIEWIEWAQANMKWSRNQSMIEGQRFIDSALAKRRTYVDWMAAWRQWCRSPFQKTVPEADLLKWDGRL